MASKAEITRSYIHVMYITSKMASKAEITRSYIHVMFATLELYTVFKMSSLRWLHFGVIQIILCRH